MVYSEEDYLPLSGLQHLAFCERQWGLIHIDRLWAENLRTAEGKVLHRNVDDPDYREKRGDTLVVRAVPVASARLGVFGIADVVEYHRDKLKGQPISGEPGLWSPVPIEYKVGKKKADDRDEIQLCAQAICLEEMTGTTISSAFFYYHQPRRREVVELTKPLRQRVEFLSNRMHQLFAEGQVSQPVWTSACKACSLDMLCLPKISSKSTGDYIERIVSSIQNRDE